MIRDEPSPDRLVDSADAAPVGPSHPVTVRSRWPLRSGLASLVALMLLSVAFTFVTLPGQSHGPVLALFKVVALGYLFMRVRVADVYTLQWSSMFILLFMAEGLVRATSDAYPSSALGLAEAVLSIIYFVAMLAYLRPLKKIAKRSAEKA